MARCCESGESGVKTKIVLYRVNGGALTGINIDDNQDASAELDRILDGQLEPYETPVIEQVITQQSKG